MSEKTPSVPPKITVNPPVFVSATLLVALLVIMAILIPDSLDRFFNIVQSAILRNLSWFYVLTVAIILITIFYLCFSRLGDIKLGPDHAEPRYSYLSWFSMLFSAGVGIGILFFGVAEPVMHFLEPPSGPGETIAAAKEAMQITFFHWGFHAWSIYTLVGLVLAYFSFRKNLPLTLRSALYPLIGNKIHGWIGHSVDSFAIISTLFGIATSLGYGVLQINAGFSYVFGLEQAREVQVVMILIITLFATFSVASGLDKGIRRLSEANLTLAIALLVLLLMLGPTIFLFQSFLQNFGGYLSQLVYKTFNLYAYEPTDWLGGWTLLYWAWWLSWSPFVGMFIARISWGRSIREFILGVMLVPTGFTLFWISVFGGSAIYMILFQGATDLANAVNIDVAVSLFAFFEHLPFSKILSFVASMMVIIFFVTSADSGSVVIDMLGSTGSQQSPMWQPVYWTIMQGVIAASLLLAGGLGALQTATIISAFPFAVIILFATYSLIKALQMDNLKRQSLLQLSRKPRNAGAPGEPERWRTRLATLAAVPVEKKVRDFLTSVAAPALVAVADELKHRGVDAHIDETKNGVQLTVNFEQGPDFIYAVRLRFYEPPSFILPQMSHQKKPVPQQYAQAERFLADGSQGYNLASFTREQLIADILDQYESHLQFLRLLEE